MIIDDMGEKMIMQEKMATIKKCDKCGYRAFIFSDLNKCKCGGELETIAEE